jgi:hypothetical protein
MNFSPLPDSVAEKIGQRLVFQPACSVLDACAGEGRALIAMTSHAPVTAATESNSTPIAQKQPRRFSTW